jgi:hypothetical protein
MFVLRFVLFLLPVLAAWVPTTAHAQNPDDRIVGYTPILTGDSTWWAYKYTD